MLPWPPVSPCFAPKDLGSPVVGGVLSKSRKKTARVHIQLITIETRQSVDDGANLACNQHLLRGRMQCRISFTRKISSCIARGFSRRPTRQNEKCWSGCWLKKNQRTSNWPLNAEQPDPTHHPEFSCCGTWRFSAILTGGRSRNPHKIGPASKVPPPGNRPGAAFQEDCLQCERCVREPPSAVSLANRPRSCHPCPTTSVRPDRLARLATRHR